MKSSYKKEDVTILLKDITGMVSPLSILEREKIIQQGVHYSELLPEEYKPTKEYTYLYNDALERYAFETAKAVAELSEKIKDRKGENIVLVSLARAGTPIGILIKRYLEKTYNIQVFHYTISIIRDIGLDENAMGYILEKHNPKSIQFVDGWVGKGTITKELKKAVKDYEEVDDELAVLADPAGITKLYGTNEDFLIPSACLNAPVSGLFSRTVLNNKVISKGEFHGAVYYEEMEDIDVSYEFINKIEECFPKVNKEDLVIKNTIVSGAEEVEKIATDFDINDINYIKPGIGETTRVLLRRIPWKILVRDKKDINYINHILRLCEEKNVEVIEYPLINYRACGIIKKISDI